MVNASKVGQCLVIHLAGAALFSLCFALVVLMVFIMNPHYFSDLELLGRISRTFVLIIPVSYGILLPFLPITYRSELLVNSMVVEDGTEVKY